MAQETKVGLLVGLALILLVGLVLSDLLTGEEPEADPVNSPTNFSRGVQDDIYRQPPVDTPPTHRGTASDRYTQNTAAATAGQDPANPYGEDAQPYRSAPNAPTTTTPGPATDTRVTPPANEPPLPQLDTQDASAPNAVARFDASLQAMRLASAEPRPDTVDRALPTDPQPAESVFAAAVPGTAVTDGPALPVPDRVAQEPALPRRGNSQTVYVYVQPGQTLIDIARQQYGNPEFATVLAQVNADRLTRSGVARAGTRLELPPLDSPAFQRMLQPVHAEHAAAAPDPVPALPTRPPAPPVPRGDAGREIRVAAGDTLSGLASQYLGNGSRWDELLQANRDRLESPQDLRAGMTLRLPTDLPTAPPTTGRETQATAPATASASTYTVVAGDNLTRIAARFLGSGDRWDELLEANADQLRRPEQLRAGMVLKIPGRSATSPTTPDAPPAPPTPAAADTGRSAERTYTVRAGDNLTRIATQALGNGGRWDEIFEANRDQLDSPDALVAGQVLRLP